MGAATITAIIATPKTSTKSKGFKEIFIVLKFKVNK